jgi:hypothetical protein
VGAASGLCLFESEAREVHGLEAEAKRKSLSGAISSPNPLGLGGPQWIGGAVSGGREIVRGDT